jgi:hypothetical protein
MVAGHHGAAAVRQGGGERLGRAVIVVLGTDRHQRRHPDPRQGCARGVDEGVENVEQGRRVAAD